MKARDQFMTEFLKYIGWETIREEKNKLIVNMF